jgi:hypothetical protein
MSLANANLERPFRAELTSTIARRWHDRIVRYTRTVLEDFENIDSWPCSIAAEAIGVTGQPMSARVKDEH